MKNTYRWISVLAGIVLLLNSPGAFAVKKEVNLGATAQNANQTFEISWTDPKTKQTVTKEEESDDKGVVIFDFPGDGTYTFTNKKTKEQNTVNFAAGVVTVAAGTAASGSKKGGKSKRQKKSDKEKVFGNGSSNFSWFWEAGVDYFKWDKLGDAVKQEEEAFRSVVPNGQFRSDIDDNSLGVGLYFGGEYNFNQGTPKRGNSQWYGGFRVGLGVLDDQSATSNFDFSIVVPGGTREVVRDNQNNNEPEVVRITEPDTITNSRIATNTELDMKWWASLELNTRVEWNNFFSVGAIARYARHEIDIKSMAAIQLEQAGEFVTVDTFEESKSINDSVFSYGPFIGFRFGGNTPGDPNPWYIRLSYLTGDINDSDSEMVSLSIAKYFGGPSYTRSGP